MSDRQKQTLFLKNLIRYASDDQRRSLQERFAKAERDEQCLRRAVFLVVLVAIVSVCGVGYAAVFLREFFRDPWNPVTRIFCALGLCAGICFVAFAVFRAWQRGVTNALHDECRRHITAMVESSFEPPVTAMDDPPSSSPNAKVYEIETGVSEFETTHFQLRKAS